MNRLSPVLTLGAGAYVALVAAVIGVCAFVHMLAGAFQAVGTTLARALS